MADNSHAESLIENDQSLDEGRDINKVKSIFICMQVPPVLSLLFVFSFNKLLKSTIYLHFILNE